MTKKSPYRFDFFSDGSVQIIHEETGEVIAEGADLNTDKAVLAEKAFQRGWYDECISLLKKAVTT